VTSFRFRALPAALSSKTKRGALRNLVRQMGPLRGPFARESKVETGRCQPPGRRVVMAGARGVLPFSGIQDMKAITVKKARKSKPKKGRRPTRRYNYRQPQETKAAEAMTVGWTVCLTAVLLCDLVAIIVHLVIPLFFAGIRWQVFENLMLFSGSLIGLFCLILVPVVYRVRQVPPPIGIVMFAIFISTAPIVAFTARIMM